MAIYKIGDKVKIRSWKSMENEFGLDWTGDINFAGRKWLLQTGQVWVLRITWMEEGSSYILATLLWDA